jgi:hypothetical protein
MTVSGHYGNNTHAFTDITVTIPDPKVSIICPASPVPYKPIAVAPRPMPKVLLIRGPESPISSSALG